MKILAIETSCDETAIAILEGEGNAQSATFSILGNVLLSQVEKHREFGGVFPMLAKREHAKNLVPILEAALAEAELLHEDKQALPQEVHDTIAKILEREPELDEAFLAFISECETPDIDAIAVTAGPGLEPALWVGINFARALALVWNKPLVAVNHMEGHVLAALAREEGEQLVIGDIDLPVLALLISGGHTELVLMKKWLHYGLVGQTRDDAVGEAFDKVARMLGLPYPGGPEISKLAELARRLGTKNPFTLPRPMMDTPSCDFSFAGLKTAALYLLRDNPHITDDEKMRVAEEFEDAATDVLWKKTARALEETNARTLVIGGGVSANTHIRRVFTENVTKHHGVELRIPPARLTTDNAIMIGLAGFYHAQNNRFINPDTLVANGNEHLA